VIEVEFNYILLLKGDPSLKYFDKYLSLLIDRSLDVKKTIDIHREALLLYGMYVKKTDSLKNMTTLKAIRDHYFPLKVRELVVNSS